MLAFIRRSDHRLSEALRGHLPISNTPDPGGLLGLELEFSVRSQPGGRINFGSLIHHLALDGSALDPGDPNAYRCSWGGVITSDGAEAEIATPPVPTRPGFTSELGAWAETGEAALRRAVPGSVEMDGYSAHFSAAMPAKLNDRVCRLYAETFAAGLMLLMDRVDSPGLLIRPRPGRTELCGEFIEGETLPAAAAFVAGTTRACAAAVHSRSARNALPPRLNVALTRAVHRYGWYVDRRAFGTDLHGASRRVLLTRVSGGTISAQSHLELAWAAARQALADDAAVSDLQSAEAMVTGSLPLPAELGRPGDRARRRSEADIRLFPSGNDFLRTPGLRAHVRPGFTLCPVAMTWDFTVFEAAGPARRAYACVPRNYLPGFITELDAGRLDDVIAAYLALSSRRRVLSAHQQTRRPGLYDQMASPAGLIAPERDPQTGRREPAGRGAKQTTARPGKRNRQEDNGTHPRRWRRVLQVAAVVAGVAGLLAAAGVAIAEHGHHPRGPNGGSGGRVTFQPSALSFPEVPPHTSVARSLTVTNKTKSPVVVTRIRITGPARRDFSVRSRAGAGRADGSSQATRPGRQRRPRCLRPLQAGSSCAIRVVFTPSVSGPRTADMHVHFASRRQSQDVALTGTGSPVAVAITLTPTALPTASVRVPVTQQITATGGTAPYRFAVTSGALPPSLSLNPDTGLISGTPTVAGSYQFTVTATDSSTGHETGSRAYTLQITPPTAPLTLTPTTLPDAITTDIKNSCTAVSYNETIPATGGTQPYRFSVTSGVLPPPLSLDPNTGLISGAPDSADRGMSYPFTITVTDSSPTAGTTSGQYTIKVDPCQTVVP